MNKTATETKEFADQIKPILPHGKWCDIALCIPAINISAAVKAFKNTHIGIGAQTLHFEKNGAFTGEMTAEMLADVGVKYVIIGHSERRQYYNEKDITVNMKVNSALAHGLHPIVCVGESLQQRGLGVTMDFITYQVKMALAGVSDENMKNVIIAYEPIWAIGTGKTATTEQANEVCAGIRSIIRKKYGARIARGVSILYGGSMNAKNAAELLAQPDIDGGLIGGASLKPEDFVAIINAANQE